MFVFKFMSKNVCTIRRGDVCVHACRSGKEREQVLRRCASMRKIWWWWFVGIFILHFPIAAATYQHLPPLLSTLQPALDDYQFILHLI